MRTGTFTAQAWRGENLVSESVGVEYTAAKIIADAWTAAGCTSRLMSEGVDYCEVYMPDGSSRTGSWAETTRIIAA